MSGPALFFAFCVFFLFVEINCIQNHRPHTETQWRLNNRQDLYSHPRLLVWKPVLPQQLYMNPKTPMLPGSMPINYNRYGFSHLPAQLKPQSYIFAMPTPNQKLQPYGLNEMAEKRKPGNFHHITIINAVIPKPHFPPPTPPTTQFFPTYPKYRNNKHLYHPYLNKLTGWNNISRIPIVAQQYQPIYGNMPIASSSTAISKPIIDNYNIVKEREPKSYSCFGKSLPKDSIQIASTHSCETIPQGHNVSQQKIIPLPQQTTKVEVSTPSTPPSSSFKPDVVETTTQKIFLPTPIAHHPISSTTPPTIVTSNFITFVPLRQNEPSSTRKEAYHHRQQHNFFTLEDAITKPPSINQIFNDPWEAFKHAQSQQQNSMRLQSNARDTLKTTKQSFMHNFFDDNYDTLETQQIDDYTNFDKGYNDPDPYYVNTNEYVAPIRNRIIDENQNKENRLHETHLRYKQTNGNQYQYTSTSPPYRYTGISKSKTTTLIPTSAEIPTSKLYNLIKYTTSQSLLDDTTTTRLIEDQTSDSPLTTTSISDHSKLPVYTTVATSTTTRENIFKKTKLKRPFYQGQNATHKYPKTIRGLFKPNKNSTSTTSTTVSPLLATKKTSKYNRQYKSKKIKLLKYTLTSSTSTSTTTQPPPVSTTYTQTVETSTTSHRRVTSIAPSTESTRRAHRPNKQSRSQKTTSRNTNRAQVTSTEKTNTVSVNRSRGKNKHRRRNQTAENIRSTASYSGNSMSKPTSINYSETSTTSRSRLNHNETRSKSTNVPVADTIPIANDADNGLLSTKDGNVPPLPIEIYFKRSQHSKI